MKTLCVTLALVMLVGCGRNSFKAPVGAAANAVSSGEVEMAETRPEMRKNSSASDPEWGTLQEEDSSKTASEETASPVVSPVSARASSDPKPETLPTPKPAAIPKEAGKDATPIKNPNSNPAPDKDKVANKETPAAVTVGAVKREDFVAQGELSPTVYYQALILDSNSLCRESDRVKLPGRNGVELARVCPSTLQQCLMEGSCQISQNGITRSFNVGGNSSGVRSFFESKNEECPFGYGVKLICLDPFYTVAADPRYHQAGDVIYVPNLKGKDLPDGTQHTGYMVVRDVGGGIKGAKRFDFFSGNIHWRDPKNPFTKAQLADSRARISFYKVLGASAEKVRSYREFPSLPAIQF
jgi:3D (Asp-Asp-Asp) domain-containing protein